MNLNVKERKKEKKSNIYLFNRAIVSVFFPFSVALLLFKFVAVVVVTEVGILLKFEFIIFCLAFITI